MEILSWAVDLRRTTPTRDTVINYTKTKRGGPWTTPLLAGSRFPLLPGSYYRTFTVAIRKV
jgi:hypothetical protein